MIRLHGEVPFRDLLAVHWPSSQPVFVERLYRELDAIIRTLESDADLFDAASEVAISRQIVRQLERAGYLATAEEHTRGHVDITVRSGDRKRDWLGESKRHKDNSYLAAGLVQLLSRYATGRDADGGLLIFVQKKGCDRMVAAWRRYLETKSLERLERCEDDPTARCFRSIHIHDAGSPYTIRHMAVHLFFAPRDR
jgi:hypothetical protein